MGMETELLTKPPAAADAPRDPEALIGTHQRMLWRYLRLLGAEAAEAEDLMQETFLRVLGRPFIQHSDRQTAALIRKVALNAYLDNQRRAGRHPNSVAWTDAVEQLVQAEPETLDDHRIDALRQCMERLNGKAHAALHLRHSEGLGVQATAQRLGLTLNGCKALLRRAHGVLRECIQQRTEQSR